MTEVAVISYNAGNTLSVVSALSRLGANAVITSNLEKIQKATHIVFPGVGHAGPAAAHLIENGLDVAIKNARQPLLGICLGMQLLCKHTEEGDTPGLGVFDVECQRFNQEGLKVPHMGWNCLSEIKGPLFKGIDPQSYVYFVHSYKAEICPFTAAVCDYGVKFSAALEFKNFFGVQFHPEKSSDLGAKILGNFLSLGR